MITDSYFKTNTYVGKPPTKTAKHEQKPIKCRNKASVHSLYNERQILVDKICLYDSLSFVIPDTFIYNFFSEYF